MLRMFVANFFCFNATFKYSAPVVVVVVAADFLFVCVVVIGFSYCIGSVISNQIPYTYLYYTICYNQNHNRCMKLLNLSSALWRKRNVWIHMKWNQVLECFLYFLSGLMSILNSPRTRFILFPLQFSITIN